MSCETVLQSRHGSYSGIWGGATAGASIIAPNSQEQYEACGQGACTKITAGIVSNMSLKISVKGAIRGQDGLKPLRRTLTPYRGQIIIFSLVSIFILVVGYRSLQWALMWSPAVLWAIFAAQIYIGLQYRVLWDKNGVVMRASGMRKETRIQYGEITKIKIERAGVSEVMAQSRPFRRIVVYGAREHTSAYIDISLRHFQPRDIDEVLREIHIRRPDLVVPAIPWGEGSL